MNDSAFLDTNVVVYLFSEDESDKRDIACGAANRYRSIVSTQTLNEASNVWFKKCGWSKEKIRGHLDAIEKLCFDTITVNRKTINKALDLKDRYGYSYYDSLMLASALEGNCEFFFSEDMSDGQVIDAQLEIVNPFKRLQEL